MAYQTNQRHVKFLYLAIVQILLLAMAFSTSFAATETKSKVDTKSKTGSKTKKAPAEEMPAAEPSVTKVLAETVRLGDVLKVEVHNLGELVKKNQNIWLYLNGRAVKGISPEVYINNEILYFTLERNDDSKKVLDKVWGAPKPPWVRSVDVSVGPESGPIPSDQKVNFVIISKGKLYFLLIIMFLVGVILLIIAPKTEMLRNYNKGSPYSLALIQMAFWFFLVFLSYVFINLVTGEWDIIPESILVLLGIAGGTMLGARVIDDNKLNALKTTKINLQNQLAELQAQNPPPRPQITALMLQIADTDAAINHLLSLRSNGFLNDILNDVNGVSLHRFQIVVWTLVFGVIFLGKVYHDLAMPVFSATQLALIGISSGTYLGFKLPEKH